MRRTGLNAPRSRAGCEECRRRRKKCSQDKPACTLCQRNGKECSYERKLQWGGRPFSKSIFGQYSGELTALKGDEGSFVYAPASQNRDNSATSSARPLTSPSKLRSDAALIGHEDLEEVNGEVISDASSLVIVPFSGPSSNVSNQVTAPIELSPFPELKYLDWLSTPYKSLLHHFITTTAPSLSCHSSVSHDYCSTLIPLALEHPGLMAAVLHMSGHNRRALALEQNESDLYRLKAFSALHLRQLLSSQTPDSNDLALATILTLCAGDIVAGGERPGSWRTHLKGAVAMLEASDGHTGPGLQKDSMTPLQLFLRRWYLSIEATTLLGSDHQGVPTSYPMALKLSYELGPSFIDEFCGFPPNLVRIFGEFTALASEARQARENLALAHDDATEAFHPATSTLERCVERGYNLLAELDHAHRTGTIHPATQSTLTSAQCNDFHSLNASFHHSTAIHIHRRVLNTPSTSSLVQSRLKAIVQLVVSVTFSRDACPAVAFLMPLFTAGCEAIERTDQQSIERILLRMQTMYGIGNARSALSLLREIWRRRAQGNEKEVEWVSLSAELGLDLLFY